MDSKIPTSFIPKDSLRADLRPKREPVSIISIVALIIFTGSVLYLAGAYVYRYMVYKEINDPCPVSGTSGSCGLKESLAVETRDLQREKLEALKRLDTKLKNGLSILRRHVEIRPLFELLAQVTNQNIQYQRFEFNKTGITLSGVAKSYEDIAFQQKVFATDPEAQKKISNFSFSDFDANNKGQVSFKLTLVVDPSLLSYMKNNNSN